MTTPELILASTSKTRLALLRNAGIAVSVMAPPVDEDALKLALKAEPPPALALALGTAKALAVSRLKPEALVIGADQVLNFRGEPLGKPTSADDLRLRLEAMSGLDHTLETAVVCARAGTVVWQHLEAPELRMRPLSRAFIAQYCDLAGQGPLGSAGGYLIEGGGIQLFEGISGDHFAILGLPLLPLLGFLRAEGLIAT